MARRSNKNEVKGNKSESRVHKVSQSLIKRLNPKPNESTRSLARRGELIGLVTLMASIAFLVALVTFDPNDLMIVKTGESNAHHLHNAFGPVGVRIGNTLLELFGLGAFVFVLAIGAVGFRTLIGRSVVPNIKTGIALTGASISTLMLTYICCEPFSFRPFGHDPAGYFGTLFARLFIVLFSTFGASLLAVTVLLMAVSALTRRPLVRLAMRALSERGAQAGEAATQQIAKQVGNTRRQWQERRASRVAMKQAEQKASEEAEAERQVYAEEAQPLAWSPSTGLHRVTGEHEGQAVALPDTRPSGPIVRNLEESDSSDASAAAPANLPMGTPMIPKDDLIPASVRRGSEVSVHQPLTNAVHDGHTEADRVAHIAASPDDPRLIDLHSGVATMNMDAQTLADLHPSSPTSVDAVAAQPCTASTIMGLQADTLMQTKSAEAPWTPSASIEAAPTDNSGRDAQPTAPLPIIAEAAAEQSQESLKEALSARGPRIVKTAAMSEQTAAPQPAEQGTLAIGDRKEWKLPPRYLVQNPPDRIVSAPQHVLVENAHVLEQKLEDFNIKGEVTDIRPGPVVTTYEYKPAPGVKISKIVNLKDDLTMSLSALRVRVVAPIPGRDVVGIEVPNKQRQIVYFREVLESENYANSKGKLTLILGKDIEGTPVVTDLTKAPHMLVAGATGTGKSVGINTFLASMLFKASPDEVKFIMIDPKVLELSIYEGIPHLLLPPIDEPHKAELALKWAVREMERRYRVLANVKVRSIAGYHAKMPELRENVRKKRVKVVDGKKRLVDANSAGAEHLAPPAEPEEMPYIVVVIDEFADLIMASGKEVERAVARLAQKARACGIHVILATQRPSTDVITGMIKANFPTRVSFQVASSIDSKVVLNGPGAESLLGMGDLLFLPPGSSHLTRCHGTWITDEEVAALADHWKDQGEPNYDLSILEDPEADKPEMVEEKDRDARFNEAVQIVWEAQQISVSFLQRKMGIGYGRSARIVDQMEAIGLIGPARGPNKPRELLMTTDTASGFTN